MHDHILRQRFMRSLLAAALPYALVVTGCVRWESVPVGDAGARPLPRWVEVTTRDSTHYTLEEARVVPGDTLVGRAESGQSELPVRLPLAPIAHLEARVPSGAGSIGVGALVLGGLAALLALIGHS